jgi:hypothetical protein
MDNPGKRLIILSRDEIEALYGRPRFTQEERGEYFSLTPAEKGALEQLRFINAKIYFEELKKRVRAELLPRLDDVRRNVESNHNSDGPPEEHMSSLMESFDTLKQHFGDDEDVVRIIDRETRHANEWIGENTPEDPKRKPRKLGKVETADRPQGGRSIFDDIDADGDSDEA